MEELTEAEIDKIIEDVLNTKRKFSDSFTDLKSFCIVMFWMSILVGIPTLLAKYIINLPK